MKMEVTDEIKDYLLRQICDDYFKEKKLLQNIQDSFILQFKVLRLYLIPLRKEKVTGI